MSCFTYQKMISQLIDGELSAPSSEQLRIHLEGCSECQDLYMRMLSLNDYVKAVESSLPSSALAERVKERIASVRTGREETWRLPAWSSVPAIALVVLVALGLGNLAGRSLGEILTAGRPERGIELLVTDNGQAFSDVILAIGGEEQDR